MRWGACPRQEARGGRVDRDVAGEEGPGPVATSQVTPASRLRAAPQLDGDQGVAACAVRP